MKDFLQISIDELTSKKVEYGECRIVETQHENIIVRNGIVEAITQTNDLGFGIRVLKNNGWGFSSSKELTKTESQKVAKEALAIAESSTRIPGKPVTRPTYPPKKRVTQRSL